MKKQVMDLLSFAFRFVPTNSTHQAMQKSKTHKNYHPDVVINSLCVRQKTDRIWNAANVL